MNVDIPTAQQIADFPTIILFDWLEALTVRLHFCIETGLREGSHELGEALQAVLQRIDTEELSDPRGEAEDKAELHQEQTIPPPLLDQ